MAFIDTKYFCRKCFLKFYITLASLLSKHIEERCALIVQTNKQKGGIIMATVPIRYWRMALGCMTPKASDRDVEIQSTSIRYKRGEDGKATTEIEGYNIDFLAIKGCSQTVKLPLTAKKAVEELQKLLSDKQTIVRVKFNNMVIKPYALISNTSRELLTGISCTADSLEVTSVEKPEVDDELIDFT